MKQDFKSAVKTARRANVQDSLNAQATADMEATQAAEDIKNTKQQYYRFNLKLPMAYKEYLQTAAYAASTPQHITTITEYLVNLVKEDMERHEGNK